MMLTDEIRNICIEYMKDRNLQYRHITDELCWYRYQKNIKKALHELPKNACVLEIGCGWGMMTSILAGLRSDLKVYAVDITKDYITLWGRLARYKTFFISGSGTELPFPNSSFDAVISFGVMEHVGNDDKFLSEIYRVLKPGGINFMFDLPSRYGFTEPLSVKFLFILGKKAGMHETRYSKAYVKACFERHGFKEIKINYENLIPSKFSCLGNGIAYITNRYYKIIDKIDGLLLKTPFCLLAQSMNVRCEK